jgi:hypothetical protein
MVICNIGVVCVQAIKIKCSKGKFETLSGSDQLNFALNKSISMGKDFTTNPSTSTVRNNMLIHVHSNMRRQDLLIILYK